MVTPDLASSVNKVNTSLDGVVIRNVLAEIIGGRTLDTEGFAPDVIKAGHVVIRNTTTGVCKPMPISGNAYASLPSGHEYAGVVRASKLTSEPFVGIVYAGEVNEELVPYSITSIKSSLKTALPQLVFLKD